MLGFSRDLEQEADDRGAQVLLDSRYDPHALPEILDILGHDYEGLDPRVPTIWSTHPEIQARAATSRTRVAEMPHRERQVDAFEGAVLGLRALTIRDYVQDDYPQTALALAERLVQRYPDDPQLLQLLGDAWQGMGAQDRLDPSTLTDSDKKQNRRDRAKKTREQRLAEQLAAEQGRAAYERNLASAEQTYRRVLELDPTFAAAYRGLGEVYEQQKRDREAAEAYLTYVRSAPSAPDRPIVVSRLKVMTANSRRAAVATKTGIVISTVAALACTTQALAEKTTAEFASGATRPQSIALLPVEATVNRARVIETEGLVDEGLVYGEMFNSRVEAFLAAKGYEVQVIDPERINSDPLLQEYVVDANRGFDDMMSTYKPKKLESRIYNAGDSARLLADHLGVDAIGFSTLSMTITAAGKAIVAGLFGSSTAGTSSNLIS